MARAVRDLAAASSPPSAGQTTADAAERLRSLGYASGRVELGASGAALDVKNPTDEIARYETYVKTFNDGLVQLETARPLAAEATFRQLARSFPRAFEAHQYLARALAARGAYGDAVKEFDLALALNPGEPAVYFDCARALANQRRFDAAFTRLREGRRRDPSSFYGALTEGLVAKAAGDGPRAQRAFDEAVALNPALAAAHYELGAIAEGRGDMKSAEAAYRKALDGDPGSVQARRALDRLKK
jgi:tetratricopeptide (TPR) repeat protein